MAAVAVIFFSSCATQRNFEKYAQKHPVKLAELCIEKFPIRDSVGEPVFDTIRRSDNLDHTGTIDSLKQAADELVREMESKQMISDLDRKKAVDIIGDYSKENESLKRKAKSLAADISRLQANYRPCLPDTQRIYLPHFLENPAKDLVIASLYNKVAKIEQQRDDWKHRAQTRFWWLVVLVAILGIGVGLKLKGIL